MNEHQLLNKNVSNHSPDVSAVYVCVVRGCVRQLKSAPPIKEVFDS